jgi:hypothetical protein
MHGPYNIIFAYFELDILSKLHINCLMQANS